MCRVADLLQKGIKALSRANIVGREKDGVDLLCLALNWSKEELYSRFDEQVTHLEEECYRDLIERRANKEPFAYLSGKVSFLGCTLHVNGSTLIPRQETEIFTSLILEKISPKKGEVGFDLCCGSGCIGLGIKKFHPHLEVVCGDVDPKALDLARKNSKANFLSVSFVLGDLLSPFVGRKAHYIFCNPPYIAREEYESLEEEVKKFEPRKALVGGTTGIEYFLRLSRELPEFLHPKAKIFLEIGHSQKQQVEEVFASKHWKSKVCRKDWSGRDRFFFLEFCP